MPVPQPDNGISPNVQNSLGQNNIPPEVYLLLRNDARMQPLFRGMIDTSASMTVLRSYESNGQLPFLVPPSTPEALRAVDESWQGMLSERDRVDKAMGALLRPDSALLQAHDAAIRRLNNGQPLTTQQLTSLHWALYGEANDRAAPIARQRINTPLASADIPSLNLAMEHVDHAAGPAVSLPRIRAKTLRSA